jgi:DNA-binding NarL/FixJ family response regulator
VTRILLADEPGVYRTGLRIFVRTRLPDTEVVETSDPVEGFFEVRRGEPFDLVLMGYNISGVSSLKALKTWKDIYTGSRFAIVSAWDSREEILASLAAGFHGFISKHHSDDEIIAAINDLVSGRIYVPRSLAEANEPAPLGRAKGGALPAILSEEGVAKLTPRQREVLFLLAGGASNKEIARNLKIAEATTKIHMAALLRALGVRNRTEAAFKAARIIGSNNAASSPAPNAAGPLTDPEDIRTLRLRVAS